MFWGRSDRSQLEPPLTRCCLEFEELYRTHHDFVWRTLRRMGVGERDAMDAGQKVFLIAHRRLASFDGRSTVKTWLCGIALRVASDYRRSATVRREVLVGETPCSASREADQLQHLEEQERLAILDEVLSEMPVEQRAVFVLFELEEMSGEEIAALLAVPEGTVRSRLRLARRAFTKSVSLRQNQSVRFAAGGES
jgi:RNA polymerase sigma-70 factor, ECF subfamily